MNWEDFTEPDITVELLDDAAIDHCSCETYTLDDTGSVTSCSDCDISLDYDFEENCKATATQFDFGLLWTWLFLLLNSWTSGLTVTGCSLFCYFNWSGLVKATGYAKLTITGWICNFYRLILVCLDAIAKLTTRLSTHCHNHCKLLLPLLLLGLLLSTSFNLQLHLTNHNSTATSINMFGLNMIHEDSTELMIDSGAGVCVCVSTSVCHCHSL